MLHCCFGASAACCSNLRTLTLGNVSPFPCRHCSRSPRGCVGYMCSHSRLQGSADGFLTKGWTALTSLSLTQSAYDKTVTLTISARAPSAGGRAQVW